MRIVIDMQGAQGASRDRGIGRYTVSVVREFLRVAADHEVFLLFNGMLPDAIPAIRSELHGLFKPENQLVWFAQSPVAAIDPANATRRELAETIWEGAVRSLRPDWLLITSMFEGLIDDAVATVPLSREFQVSAIVYDLIPLIFHDVYLSDETNRIHYSKQLKRLKNCDLFLAISECTSMDAQRFLKIPARHVTNVGTAIEEGFSKTLRTTSTYFKKIEKPYLLYVSGADKRKNHARLIEAYSKISPEIRSAHQLVLAGSFPLAMIEILEEIARNAGLQNGEMIIARSVSEGELHSLYHNCKAVIFPSWYEGFGLPVLEAMSYGKAVIGSNVSSIPEIINNAEALFDPFNTTSMSASISKILDDGKFRNSLAENSVARANQFNWKDVAHRALNAMSENFGSRRLDNRLFVSQTIDAIKGSDILSDISSACIASCLAETFRPDNRRQLLLDISELVHRDARTGIQRVVRSILKNLLDSCPDGWIVEAVYALPNETGFRYARGFTEKFHGMEVSWSDDEPVQVWAGDIYCGLDLNHTTLLTRKELLNEWRMRGVAVWTVVYDILPLQFPDFFPDGVAQSHESWARTLALYDGAMCISKAVADDLSLWLVENKAEICPTFENRWFHLGADISDSAPTTGLPDDAESVLETLKMRPTLLMVGTVEPRKGHAQTLNAIERLWADGTDINFVIVGKSGWDVDDLSKRIIAHKQYKTRLHWLNGITDEYLDLIYAHSDLLISASEGEGFGLPLIEAAQKGIPLLLRNIPVFQEIAGQNAHYFEDILSPDAIYVALKEWLALHEHGNHPTSSGLGWLSWKESATQFFQRITAAA